MNRPALFALLLAATLPPGLAHASDLEQEPSDDGVEIHGFVSRHPGAIGYVSAGTDLRGARAVEVR